MNRWQSARGRTLTAGLVFIALVATGAGPAAAQEAGGEDGGPGWRTLIELHGFAPWTSEADLTVGGETVEFESSGEEILDEVEAGGAARIEAWRGRLGLLAGAGLLQLGQQGAVGPDAAPLDARVRWASADLMAGLVALTVPGGPRPDSPLLRVELGAGVRGELVDGDIELGGEEGAESERAARFIGTAQVPVQVTEVLRLRARGTVAAGEGVSWSGLVGGELVFDTVAVAGGYRYDALEHGGEQLDVDAQAHSVFLSVGVRLGGGW